MMPESHPEAQENLFPEGHRTTELGPLPEEWRVVRLGEMAYLGSHRQKPQIKNALIPFVPMSLLPEDGVYVSNWEMRRPEEIRSGIVVQEGDFLLAKITPCLENGKQGIVKDIPGDWGFATTEVIPIRPISQLHTEYLALYLRQTDIREELASKMEGTTGRQRLPKAVLEQLLIPLPPLAEQRAIAHVLRTVQEAKEATARVIAAARELKKSLMRHLFTYGPVPVGAAPVGATGRSPLQETEIGPVPAHWRVVRLGEVCCFRGGTQPPKSEFRLDKKEGYIRLLQIRDFESDEYAVYVRDNPKLRKVNERDVLIARYGASIGQILRGKSGAINVAIVQTAPDEEQLDRDFLYYLLSERRFQSYVKSLGGRSAQAGFNRGELNRFPIPLPPLAEQQEIARILQAVDEKIRAEEARKAALEGLFRSLLHHLMTAQVRLPRAFAQQYAGGDDAAV